jgi:GLPGLI family protein
MLLQGFLPIGPAISPRDSMAIEIDYRCKSKSGLPDESKAAIPPEVLLMVQEVVDAYYIDFKLVQEGKRSIFRQYEGEAIVKKKTEGTLKSFTYYLEEKDDLIYKDFKSQSIAGKKHKLSRVFHIQDELPELCWAITKEKKHILGYSCIKAVIEDYHGQEVVAWFTPQVPVPNGPLEFGDLPGLILELTKGNLVYTAVNVRIAGNRGLDGKIEKPKPVSKAISLKEYYEAINKSDKKFGSK